MDRPLRQAVRPEKRLLVYCARTRIDSAVSAQIRQLATGPLHWDRLLSQAAGHSVTSLLCRQLPMVAADLLDPAQLERLRARAQAQTLRSLAFSGELVAILNRFRSEGVQAIPYKGPVLAAQAYGDLALREFGDLDIILRQRDMPRAHDIMIACGYRPKFSWYFSAGAAGSSIPGEYNYRHEARRLLVELHTERTLRHFPVPPNLDDLASRLVSVPVGGHDVLTFAPEDTLVLLCVHGCKDFWEKLAWIADVAQFIQAWPQFDWDRTLRVAESLRARRMLFVGLALAVRFYDAPVAAEILSRVRRDLTADSIASQVDRDFFAPEPRARGAVARFNSRRRLVDGALSGWRYSLRLATAPSDDDWSVMRLPALISPLHSAFRPFRLLRKYGATGAGDPR